jgi:hypothetical protein
MKLTSVELYPANSSNSISLGFQDLSRQNSYNVKSIDGLDADAITPRFYGPETNDFYDLSLDKRDIVLQVQLNPNYGQNQTISDLRDTLYKVIASSRTGKIQLQFKNEEYTVAAISGFVTKFEASHFEKNPEVQLTVKCDDPMLKALNPVTVSVTGLGFTRAVIVDDKSTAPHGFKFEIGVLGTITDTITITDPDDSAWHFSIAMGFGMINGDTIVFSTDYKDRQLYVLRGLAKYYIGDWIGVDSVWPLIFPGMNTFAFTHPTLLAWHNLSYYPTYWGV